MECALIKLSVVIQRQILFYFLVIKGKGKSFPEKKNLLLCNKNAFSGKFLVSLKKRKTIAYVYRSSDMFFFSFN